MPPSDFSVLVKLLVFIAAVLVLIAIELGALLAWLRYPAGKESDKTTREDDQQ